MLGEMVAKKADKSPSSTQGSLLEQRLRKAGSPAAGLRRLRVAAAGA